ncbi:sporulation protein [Nocardiopsis sp. CNT312]|uniref:sporulation protein n=1 Tax=Nocardiopsis sp. CNT312 TaxID=1137268 RepID=UPI000491DB1A|nr:sporulation protein [Nocardiopsis sp. CNT312]
MNFKRMLATVGIGGATVESTLDSDRVEPGGTVSGTIKVTAGKVAQTVEGVTVGLRATVEKDITYKNLEGEKSKRELNVDVVVAKNAVSEAVVTLEPGQELELPFELAIPMEAPVTSFNSIRFLDYVGLNTSVAMDNAIDRKDVDPLSITPLPAQAAVLEALIALGFEMRGSDLEKGEVSGARQKLPFYQEFVFGASEQYAGLDSLELSFFTDDAGVDVVLEFDKEPGALLGGGGEEPLRLSVEHGSVDPEAITGRFREWLDAKAAQGA